MKPSAIGVMAAALLAGCCSTALAQQQAAAHDAPPQVQISRATAAPAYRLAPQEFDSYARPYLLDNGIVIHFFQRRRQYFTQMYHEAPVELLPQAPGKFTTAQGAKVEFMDEGDTIAVTHLDRIPYTGLVPVSSDRVYIASR
ncbi:MAG: hypothetical protein K2X55_24650 [Burkholderiaceae bacterium]|nr:hypothetical protein [Burkholderiaceae bacterium]